LHNLFLFLFVEKNKLTWLLFKEIFFNPFIRCFVEESLFKVGLSICSIVKLIDVGLKFRSVELFIIDVHVAFLHFILGSPDEPFLFIFPFQKLHLKHLNLTQLIVADVFKSQQAIVVLHDICIFHFAVWIDLINSSKVERVKSITKGARDCLIISGLFSFSKSDVFQIFVEFSFTWVEYFWLISSWSLNLSFIIAML